MPIEITPEVKSVLYQFSYTCDTCKSNISSGLFEEDIKNNDTTFVCPVCDEKYALSEDMVNYLIEKCEEG
ncbi:MAG: hypothetical protein ACOCRK_03035 [bacterium]